MEYLDAEEKRNHKQEYYLAQIASEIRMQNVKDPSKVKISDFLFHYDTPQPVIPEQKEDVEKSTQNIKNFWFTITGLNRKRKNRLEKHGRSKIR